MLRSSAALVLMTLFISFATYLDDGNKSQSEAAFLLIPSSKYAEAVSLGFKPLLADSIYLWSIQYYGDYTAIRSGEFIWRIFDVITDLDPDYKDPYFLGSLVMSLNYQDRELALALIQKGWDAHPDDWQFPYEAGFLAKESGQYERAAQYFYRAHQMTGAISKIKHLQAAMLKEAGRYVDSYRIWLEIFESTDNIWTKNSAARNIFDLKVILDEHLVRRAAEAYQARAGQTPPSLSALVQAGLLKTLPKDPNEEPYLYDPDTGALIPSSHFRLLKE